uniref:Uncharacterized protein n=1 Tax=Megaselia scalaris TaxID=36166 RepID=T1H3D3_MEGSC
MRSTVSYMLSHSGSELVMSHPDYDIQTYHHGCLLVLLRGIGPSKPRSLQRVFEKVRRINNVKIVDSSGNTRDIWVRYIHEHPVENNDWGDFQTHRRLLGLITIGKFESQVELNELCRLHESLKDSFGSYSSGSFAFDSFHHRPFDSAFASDLVAAEVVVDPSYSYCSYSFDWDRHSSLVVQPFDHAFLALLVGWRLLSRSLLIQSL